MRVVHRLSLSSPVDAEEIFLLETLIGL